MWSGQCYNTKLPEMFGKPKREHVENWERMFQQIPTTIGKDPVETRKFNRILTEKSEDFNSANENKIEIENNKILQNNNKIVSRKLREIVPYHVRLEKYLERRKEIFGNNSLENKKILNTRLRYKNRKSEKKAIASALIPSDNDVRPYLNVSLNNVDFVGLMDSGASVSCLGKNCLENVKKLNAEIYDFKSVIRTADGARKQIVGKVRLNVKCRDKKVDLVFYLVPSLCQELILGWSFWQSFDIQPCFINSIEEIDDVEESKIHSLTEYQKRELDKVKDEYRCYTKYGLGKTNLEMHTIDTGDAPAKKMRFYPVSPAVQELIYAELDRMLKLDVIEPAPEASWNNRMTLVIKPNKNRLCLDARELNKVTKKDAYPLPNIDGLLSRLGDTHYISAIDLKDAFWQIPLDPDSRPKTAFTVPGRPLYQFKVMPFGLCNAAQRLCRLMDRIIPHELKDRIFVYLDDLLVVSPDFETHLDMLRTVSKRLTKAGLTINMSKSKFCYREVKYLGYIVGGGKLSTDPEKVEAITKITAPKNVKDVRRFLGTVGWYRRFIPDFSTLTAPITDCLRKSKKFEFSSDALNAFQELKNRLVSSPVLSSPDFRKHFYIQCDASNVGIGAVLFQKDIDEGEHPIEYFSKKLNTAQKNYSTTEKECLAVISAIKKFRQYIELMPFTVITDHSSLQWLMKQQDLSGRLARWSLKLQGYDFNIEHRKGTKNIVPDFLSRFDMEELTINDSVIIDLKSEAFKTEKYKKLLDTIRQNQENLPDLKIIDDFVYKRTTFYNGNLEDEDATWKLWMPDELKMNIIIRSHENNTAHGGVAKTLYNIREYFYWPLMNRDVREYIRNCRTCKECKHPRGILRPPMGKEVQTVRPFQKIYVDFLGPYPRSRSGNTCLFIVLDHQTKFVLLKALRKSSTKSIIKFLTDEVFHKFGVPEILHSDNGSQFTGKEFKEALHLYGITHMRTAIHSPQSNASERVNQSILSGIRSFLQSDQNKWDEDLSNIECALRASVHSSIGISPYFALFGHHMITHADVYKIARQLDVLEDGEVNITLKAQKMQTLRDKIRQNLHKAYEKNVKTYNKRSKFTDFRPGQEVYRKNYIQSDFAKGINAKLCKPWLKCRIKGKIGQNIYEIEDLQGKLIGNIHAQHLKY